jgi:hypothetical protein
VSGLPGSGGERVAWLPDWRSLPQGRKLWSLPGTEAGWGLVPDAALTNRAAVLLYLDLAEYEHAIRGLGPEEIERAVLRRREVFRLASSDVGRVLEAVHSAMAHAAKTGERETFDALLAIAVELFAGGGRFDPVDATTLLQVALDADARAVAEARDLPLDQDLAELERRYGLDAEAMASQGRPQFTRGLLQVQRPRLCRIGPKDEALHGSFHDELHVVGPDWIAGPWPEHAIAGLRADGKDVEVIAFEPSPLPAWVVETPSQAQRDVQAALDAVKADQPGHARAYGRDLRFRQHAFRVHMAARLRSVAAAHADDVEKDVALEQSQLFDLYARTPDHGAPSLQAALDRARADAAFFATRDELSPAGRTRWLAMGTALAAIPTGRP